MTIQLTDKELDAFEEKLQGWFFACINEVVPKMLDKDHFIHSSDRDYRDHCARLIKDYRTRNPIPTWRNIL